MAAEEFIGKIRQCKKCGASKDLSLFHKHPTCVDGRLHACKACSGKDVVERQRLPHNRAKRGEAFSKKWASDPEFRRVSVEKNRSYFSREDVRLKLAQKAKARRVADPEKARAQSRKVYRKRVQDNQFRCESRIRAAVRSTLKGKRKYSKTFEYLGYTSKELVAHLERQFFDGMSWSNMGAWHIDHIVPLSSFKYESYECPEFRAAWGLPNLRPLWAKVNLTKHARRTHLI